MLQSMPGHFRIHQSARAQHQDGLTGIETAIILIAFVVVAAVFSFTVLTGGIFSSEQSKEAIYSGLRDSSGALRLVGG